MLAKSFAVSALLLTIVAVTPALAQWQPDQRLTNDQGQSGTTCNNAWGVAVTGETVHVAWFDDRGFGDNREIYYQRSTTGGVNWDDAVRLSDSDSWSLVPAVAVAGVTVHVVWNDMRAGGQGIYYRRSADGGSFWSEEVKLTSLTRYGVVPSVAAGGTTVHTVWWDDRDGNNEVYYKRSTDGGETWDSDVRLTNDAGISEGASVAVSGEAVHVVWYDTRSGNGEVYYKRSTDGGATWDADTRLTYDPNISIYPSVAVAGDLVHLVWVDARDYYYEVYYKRSTDGGATWGGDTRLTYDIGSSYSPCVAVAGDLVHLVWWNTNDCPDPGIHYQRSTDGGQTWGGDTRLTYDAGTSYAPCVAVAGDLVHVVWQDYRDGNCETYYKRSTDGGATWGSDQRLTHESGISLTPSVAAVGDVVHVVWQDNRDGSFEIYYERSTDGGATWSNDTALTNDTRGAMTPSVTAGDAAVHVVWSDGRNGDLEIYYKRYCHVGASIAGTIFKDEDGDGERDAGEPGLPSWTVKLEPGLTYTLTDANGDYQFSSLNAGEYTVSEILKTYWQLTYPPSPGTHVVELGAGQDVTGKDFGNRESCIVQNLAVSVAGGIARARRQKTYATRYENVGTIDVAATVTQVLPPEGSYVSSRPAGVYDAETHSVVWDVGMLPASFTGSLSTIVEVALVPRGTALRCSVTIEPFNGDADTSDNRCPEVESVIGSCDPNMMTVRPAPFVSAGAVLDCNIYFQNVGNDTAFDIVVREVLDPNLDVTTVEPLAASHPYAFGVGAPNELVWFFNDIKLVDSITNEPASHGFLRFRIHSKSGLPVGTTIDNSAAIYFDFNEPVATNTVQLTVVEPGWSARESVPVLPSNQPVSEGGWLAYNSGDGAIYAAKGGKTPDFYRHEPSDGAWHALAVWPDGIEGNKPSYGSAGCADGSGRVYATKGNNTLGFWQYDAVADSWHQRADVPLGPNQQKVKGGTDIVWDGDALDGHAYLLKGQKNEFYRYDADRDYWEALADAPSGSNKKWDKGSWLASDGAGIIYAHRAGDNELYAYDTASGRWSAPLEGMPFVGRSGRKKASGDGGCGAYLAGAVYALKGGGTQECWKYTTATNSWSEEDSLPRGAAGTTVGPGAGIVAADARLFATKGNKSSEFWQYVPYSFLFGEPPPGGVMAGPSVVSRASFTVSPNPVASGFVTLSFAGPLDHLTTRPLAVALFDVTGRVVLKSPIANRHSPLALDLRSMPAGVYVLTVRGARNTVYATKLVVQR